MLAKVGEQLSVLREALIEPGALVVIELLEGLSRRSVCLAHETSVPCALPARTC